MASMSISADSRGVPGVFNGSRHRHIVPSGGIHIAPDLECGNWRWIARCAHVRRQTLTRTGVATLGHEAVESGQWHRLVVVNCGRADPTIGFDLVDAGMRA